MKAMVAGEQRKWFALALLSAVQVATMAASPMARITAGPASPAAIPMLTTTPVPTMEPMPIMVAPNRPTSRFNSSLAAVSVTLSRTL